MGEKEGDRLGLPEVGASEGDRLGWLDVGATDGDRLGRLDVGEKEGERLGLLDDGANDGDWEGLLDAGAIDGDEDGVIVGYEHAMLSEAAKRLATLLPAAHWEANVDIGVEIFAHLQFSGSLIVPKGEVYNAHQFPPGNSGSLEHPEFTKPA